MVNGQIRYFVIKICGKNLDVGTFFDHRKFRFLPPSWSDKNVDHLTTVI